jgi:Protein of unknown function (DUF3306)
MGDRMSADSESFLARWSRRKLAAEREAEQPAESLAPDTAAAPPAQDGSLGVAAAEPAPAPAPERDPATTTEVPLPPIESLDGLRSDYQAFFQQPVADELRRAALKKLFADPHFNQMDMMDVYVDDYTQFEPLPEALRLRLPSARAFLLDAERAALDAAEASAGADGDAQQPLVAIARGDVDPAASPGDGGEGCDLAADDAKFEPTSAPTGLPTAVSPDAPPAEDPAGPLHDASPTAGPLGKAIVPDPTST